MRATWQDFLTSAGAVIAADRVQHFGAPEREHLAAAEADIVCDLSHHALLAVSGADASGFLQGQLTSDLRALDDSSSQLAAHCNHKGRVLALFRMWRTDGGYLLSLPAALAADATKRLSMYVLRSDVAIRDASAEWTALGLSGPGAPALLEAAGAGCPSAPGAVWQDARLRVTRIAGPHPRCELLAHPDSAAALWTSLARTATAVGAPCWDWLDIAAVLPQVNVWAVDRYTPQMLNLDVLGAVSFDKGCYTGQEVVARTQTLGAVKRRAYGAHLDGADAPAPGAHIGPAGGGEGKRAGEILLSSPAPNRGWDALVVAPTELAELDALECDGAPARLLPPVYSLEQRKPGRSGPRET